MFWGEKKPSSKPDFHEIKPSDFAGLEARIRGKPTIVLIYASWCMHCIVFKPQYNAFARKVKAAKLNVQVLGIESEVLKTLNEKDRKLFDFVTGSRGNSEMYFPKVMTFRTSGAKLVRKEYTGERTEEALMAFTHKQLVPKPTLAAVTRKPQRKGLNEQLHGVPRQI